MSNRHEIQLCTNVKTLSRKHLESVMLGQAGAMTQVSCWANNNPPKKFIFGWAPFRIQFIMPTLVYLGN